MSANCYSVLQVARNANEEVITASFQALVSKISREQKDNPETLAVSLKVLTYAYQTLTNPALRAEHDRRMDAGLSVVDATQNNTTEKVQAEPTKPRVGEVSQFQGNGKIEPTFNPAISPSEQNLSPRWPLQIPPPVAGQIPPGKAV